MLIADGSAYAQDMAGYAGLIIPIVLLWIYAGFWWALGYFIAFPFMFIIAWNYMKIFLKFIGSFNFVAPKNRGKVKELKALRKSIFERLDNILK